MQICALIQGMQTEYIPVQHDGEFVLTRNGNKDFGEISSEIARQIRRQAGKIRLRIGNQEINSEQGYGEKHIKRHKRLKELKLFGFDNARDFVAYISENYDAIYEGEKSQGKNLMLIALSPDPSP